VATPSKSRVFAPDLYSSMVAVVAGTAIRLVMRVFHQSCFGTCRFTLRSLWLVEELIVEDLVTAPAMAAISAATILLICAAGGRSHSMTAT
jgi:hypothetical protein